jgi:hypothetical protein
MDSFSDLIDKLGGAAAVAVVLGIPESHARTMKARDSIPVERWERVVGAAKARGLSGVTYEALTKLAASKRSALPEKDAAA